MSSTRIEETVSFLSNMQAALEQSRVFFDTDNVSTKMSNQDSVIINAGRLQDVEGLKRRLSVLEKLVALSMGFFGINAGFNSFEDFYEDYNDKVRIETLIARVKYAKNQVQKLVVK